MPGVQARDIDEELHGLIRQSASKNERSVESEVKVALDRYYRPDNASLTEMTQRQRWQAETGQRLRELLDILIRDGYFLSHNSGQVGIPTLVHIARELDVSPGCLMDLLDGQQEITLSFADSLAEGLSANADWLLSGIGKPFIVSDISSSYQAFFEPPEDEDQYAFELLRINGSSEDGQLLCLRTNLTEGWTDTGTMKGAFKLAPTNIHDERLRLAEFIIYLKRFSARNSVNVFTLTPPDVLRCHTGWHPVCWFQNAHIRQTDSWLSFLFQGMDYDGWLGNDSALLRRINQAPSG